MLTIKIPKGTDLVVIGDVHEQESHFNNLIKELNIGPNRILVSVGDIYDKGNGFDVAESIIKKIQDLHSKGFAYMVRGNHEQRKINDKIISSGIEWCKTIPLALSFTFYNQSRISIIHGGVSPKHTLESLDYNSEILYARNINDAGNPDINGVPWYELYDGRFGYIIHGHSLDSDGSIKYNKHSCNVDTCCYKTGILAGQIISNGVTNGNVLIDN